MAKKKKEVKEMFHMPNYHFLPTQDHMHKIIEVSEKIAEGGNRQTIQKWIKESYEVGDRQARAYYSEALKFLMPEDVEAYKKELIFTNINRLETIIEETMQKKGYNYTIAIQAIKELNKVLGVGDGKMIAVETPDTKFVIKLDD